MKRFLPPRELARDLRFKRAQSKNELFRTLPDDVAGIVRVLEQVAPKLRERVEGTALEAVFDDLGPGFMFLTTAAGTAQSTERTPLQLRASSTASSSASCKRSRPRAARSGISPTRPGNSR